MSPEKRVFATQVIEFLGLLIDTLLMIIRLPADKQWDILKHICDVLSQGTAPAASLQSLMGKLNFIANTFPLGCPFICRLYDLAAGKHPCHVIPVSGELCKDLQLWAAFLAQFQGWLPILDQQQWWKATMVIYTDTSANPKLGWGVYVPSWHW